MRPLRSGFTLFELLVSCAILSMIGLVMTQMFFTSRTVMDKGSAQVDLHGKAREVLRRISPMLMTAIPDPATAGADDGIVLADDTRVEFTTTDYLLGEGDFKAWVDGGGAGALPFQTYRIRFDGAGGSGDVLLERVDDNTVAPRTLFFSVPESRITQLSFREVSATAQSPPPLGDAVGVQVTVVVETTARNATRAQQTVSNQFTTIVQLPYFTTE
ncbi:MAG: prepilin-type N-terminal cleavage/methylation domain-containing protein [Armatimonadetes bacterium]|nr:prepilin-type N-terminal cleavage/methylation domain-containing protein [Armatimonadota bacterium]